MTETKKISIKEIAEMAGVSVSAVSRYLNNGYVSEGKKAAIKEAIEKTGYLPSKQAQVLRSRKTKLIGVIVPKLRSEAISYVADGIMSVLNDTDYHILFADTQGDLKKEISYLGLFDNNPVDGIILSGTCFTKMHRNALKKISVPVVIAGQKFDGYPCVYHDDLGSAKALTQHLIDVGCKKICCIGVNQEDKAAGYDRVKGYRQALTANRRKFSDEMYAESEFSIEGGYACAEQLASANKDMDGLFCATDSIAIGAMQRLKELGLRVPEDVKVVGVGHNRISRVVSPRLTTAHLYYKNCGMESAKLLLEMIASGQLTDKQIQLGYEIVQGDSSKAD